MERPHIYANTISIPSIVEIILFTHAPSTESSPPKCNKKAGSALNFQYGKSYKPRATKSKRLLTKSPIKSSSNSSTDIKAFLEPLNTSNITCEHILEAVKKSSNRMFGIEYDNQTDWEFGLEKFFTEEQIVSINNMLTYELNKRRGFRGRDDEECNREERKADSDNKLYAEAMYGLELLENSPELRKYFKYLPNSK